MHVARADRPNQKRISVLPQREDDQDRATGFGSPDGFETRFGTRMSRIGNDGERLPKQRLDGRER